MRRILWVLALALTMPESAADSGMRTARVVLRTELGSIEVEVDRRNAPVTAENFLRYVAAGHYDGGRFHRTVKPDNQPNNAVKIQVIQAGVAPAKEKHGFPPIMLERTYRTGI